MKKMIILDITKEDYEEGMEMLQNAIVLAVTHGMWDGPESLRIFGENGWLPAWDQLKDVEE
jgi:hypothetical protein